MGRPRTSRRKRPSAPAIPARDIDQAVDDAMRRFVGNTFAHEVVLLAVLTKLRDILGRDEIGWVLADAEATMIDVCRRSSGTGTEQYIASALQTLNVLGKCLGYGDLFGHPGGQSPSEGVEGRGWPARN